MENFLNALERWWMAVFPQSNRIVNKVRKWLALYYEFIASIDFQVEILLVKNVCDDFCSNIFPFCFLNEAVNKEDTLYECVCVWRADCADVSL